MATWALKDKYAISGIGFTEFSKNSRKSVQRLASEACLNAVRDSGIDIDEIDGLVSYSMNDSVMGVAVATELGIPNVQYALDYFAGGNAANLIVSNAASAIEAGMATNVVCFRAMNGRSGFRFGGGGNAEGAAGVSQYCAPFGLVTYGQAMAMWCRRHMIKYGTTSEQLGVIATTFRENALRNPRAMMQTPLTMDEYMQGRMIVDPFRIYDLCLETDGACAVLVTSAERAKDLRKKPVYITSAAYGGGPSQGQNGEDLLRWPDHSHNAYPYIKQGLWEGAGMTKDDIDFAQIYDCFTYSVLMALEGLGLCPEGEGGPFVQDGNIRVDTGSLPLNTAGGLLSEGYIHGLNHVIEAVQQLRGEAGERQLKNANVGLTTAGAMTCASALILRN